MRRESAKRRLDRLRRRLTAAFGLVALISIVGLAIVTTVIDGQLRDDRFAAELQGRASRAAALVFIDEATGRWDVNGVVDDSVAEAVDGIVIFDSVSGVELFATAQLDGADAIIAATLRDAEEEGTSGVVTIEGRTVPAAGAPYFGVDDAGNDDVVVGAVVVATERGTDPDRRRLLTFVWGAAAALAVAASAIAWTIAGRVVRPMGAQLDREEAFLATAAHELRTPLGRFRAVSESALLTTRSLPPSPERDDVAADLRRLIELNVETTRSIEDLLVLGRIEAGQLSARSERIRLDQLVSDFEAMVPELVVDTSGPVEVVADPLLVRHAVSNVLINAQRHARRAGVLLLIEATVRSVDGDAVVTIADNGPGLAEIKGDVFGRHQFGGIAGGLGLWIVKNLIEEQGGTATAHHRPEGGALFELRWPAENS